MLINVVCLIKIIKMVMFFVLHSSNAFVTSLIDLLKTEVRRCNNVQKLLAAIDV